MKGLTQVGIGLDPKMITRPEMIIGKEVSCEFDDSKKKEYIK